jgi:hypothetical protein
MLILTHDGSFIIVFALINQLESIQMMNAPGIYHE